MENLLKQQIATAVAEYAAAKNLSQNDVAKLSGVNAGYVSNIIRGVFATEVNGKAVEIGDKHFLSLADWAGLSLKKVYWHVAPTRQFIEIMSILEDCKNECKTGMVIAPTGLGKTNAIDTFCRKRPQHTFRITVNSLYKLQDLVEELGDKIGTDSMQLNSKRMSVHSFKSRMDKVCAKLIEIKRAGGEPMIIIDEAENMEQALLKVLKGLFDIIKEHASIVIFGTPRLLRNMHASGRNRGGLPELYRRFKAGERHLTPIDKSIDFKPFFDAYIPKQKGLQNLLCKLAENYGELHDYLATSLKECDLNGQELTEEFFRLKWNETRFTTLNK